MKSSLSGVELNALNAAAGFAIKIMNSHITAFLNEVKRTKAKSTYDQYYDRLAGFDYWLDKLKKKPIWNRKLVTAHLYHLQDIGVAQSSVVQTQSTLGAFYSFLVSEEVISVNPLVGAKKIAHKANSAPKLVFTEAEYQCLCVKSEGKFWFEAITIAWHTGLRMADIALLKWDEVYEKEQAIKLSPQKTEKLGKIVEIPLSETLTKVLLLRQSGQYVLPEMAAHYLADSNKSLSSQFGRILKKCGIEGKSFHSFRHTYVTRMLAAGMSVAMLSTITGQSIQVISKHYNHISLDDKKKFMATL